MCVFGSHIFVPISWMCKKQIAASHSSTESEIISLDIWTEIGWFARSGTMGSDCFLFLEIFLIFQIELRKPVNDDLKLHKSHNRIDVMKDNGAVFSNVQSASLEALLYVFENNEPEIKMIMKGRSPTMRHVSRTHRVAFDLFFDRINLDTKIQIKYIDTKNQLADILTKREFHT